MRKAVVLGLMVTVFGLTSVSAEETWQELEQAIQSSSRIIEKQLPNGAQLAILDFTTPTPNLTNFILTELAIAITSGNKLTVIDRQFTDVIKKEMTIQMSGDISDIEIRRIGNQLGAQYVVTGSIVNIGNIYRFRIIAIDVETAVHSASVSLNINRNDRILQSFLLNNSSSRIYRIGDFGPAGGLIFYDKGVFSNGWRYIEVAPQETEFILVRRWDWKNNLEGTRNDIGFGKNNTQLMVEYLNKLGESSHFAQLCNNLNFDGFNDWVLPSKDELNLIYINLKQKNLGNFDSESYYYSSSIEPEWRQYLREYNYDVIKQDFNNGNHAIILLGGEEGFQIYHRSRAIRYF